MTLVAAMVLLVNDHVLKALWPGLITGKLSDVAGLAAAPALVGFALGLVAPKLAPRALVWCSLAVVGIGFGWVKATEDGAAAASAAWSVVAGPSQVLRDPTDLVALPALALSWWAWRQVAGRPPPDDAALTRVRMFIGLPLVLLAVTATSAVPDPPAATVVELRDGDVIVAGSIWPLRSETGVGGWRPLTPGEVAAEWDRDDFTPLRQTHACVPGAWWHCYRVHGAALERDGSQQRHDGRLLGVDESRDGGKTWRTVWEVPSQRWSFLAQEHHLEYDYHARLLASVDIVVREVDGGHQVVVANGMDGLVVRDPDGAWRRVGVRAQAGQGRVDLQPRPLVALGHGLATELAGAIFVVLLGFLATGVAGAMRIRQRRPTSAAVLSCVIAGALFCATPGLGLVALNASLTLDLFAASFMVVCAVVVGLTQPVPPQRALSLVLASVLVGALVMLPYLGWTVGLPQSYATATAQAVALAIIGLVAIGPLAWWAAGSAKPHGTESHGTGLRPQAHSAGSGAPSKSTTE
ncbi:MAG: hypothetical protein ACRDTQ_08195 [Micromonosporaceae bacterium]